MGVEDMGLDTPASPEVNLDALPSTAETGVASSAAPEGEKFDLLSVVRNAVTPDGEGDAASPPGQETSDKPKTVAAETPKADPTDPNDYSDVPFHNHPRFKQLVTRAKQAEVGAKQFEQVQEFLTANSMTEDDAADALLIWAKMKTDPQAAWKELKPIVQRLLVEAGEVLPADLRQQVEARQITRDAAMEISRLRSQNGVSSKTLERQQQVAERRDQDSRVQQIKSEAERWEQTMRERDPDFEQLRDGVLREIVFLQRTQGIPNSTTGVRQQLQEAYDAVKARVPAKARPAVRPVTGGRVASGQPTAAPSSMLDIVRGATASG